MRHALPVTTIVLVVFTTSLTNAQEPNVRFFEQGGITYRETTTKALQPVREIEYKDQQQTFYREKYDSQVQAYRQYRYAPATRYVWEPRVHGRLNIFTGPHVAYHLRPQTNWQLETRTAQVPITQRRFEPETRTVKVAVPKLSMKERDVVTRTAVGPAAANRSFAAAAPAAPAIAWNIAPRPVYANTYAYAAPVYVPAYPQVAQAYATPGWNYGAYSGTYAPYGAYGGIARLDGDPPRYGYGYGAPNAGAWQARRNTTESR